MPIIIISKFQWTPFRVPQISFLTKEIVPAWYKYRASVEANRPEKLDATLIYENYVFRTTMVNISSYLTTHWIIGMEYLTYLSRYDELWKGRAV